MSTYYDRNNNKSRIHSYVSLIVARVRPGIHNSDPAFTPMLAKLLLAQFAIRE